MQTGLGVRSVNKQYCVVLQLVQLTLETMQANFEKPGTA